MQEINVDKIMEEIRAEIREKGMENHGPDFADVSLTEDILKLPEIYDKDMMHRELVNLNGIWDTSLEELTSGNPVKRGVKKAIQKAVRMVVSSHVVRQTAFNASVVDSINMLNCLAKENEALREEVEGLKEQIGQLRKENGYENN